MDVFTADVESFWDTDYSLSKLSPLQYVMGDRFELQFLSLKINDERTEVVMGDEIEYAVRSIPWHKGMALGHNMSAFDAYVLAYRLGIKPRMWGCTLAMARPIHAKTTGLSLARLATYYNVGTKNNAVLLQTKGRRLVDFTAQEVRDMRTYNAEDADQCRAVFKHLVKHYSPAELWQIDALVRMRTEPQFVLNTHVLDVAASMERGRKHQALLDLARELGFQFETLGDDSDAQLVEFVRSELASGPKFSAMLEKLGVEVPMKVSPTDPNKRIPALSKKDEGFLDLQDHENPLVAAAARARLDVKSTLLETRIEKFKTAATLAGGRLPIPIRYCGADTTGRDSGEEYNPQNMPRIIPGNPQPSDALRLSLEAPKGCKVIVADQSGIELRTNHTLWKVPSSMALYQASPDKADLYRQFASGKFNCAPEDVTKPQRQYGKVCQLQLQFGAGGPTFRRVARTDGGLIISLEEADSTVAFWRSDYPEIVGGWKSCATAILDIQAGRETAVDPWGLVTTCAEGFRLPSGRLIRYPNLRKVEDGTWPDGRPKHSWFYGHKVGKKKPARITGPKACENIVQALARDSIFDCSIEYFRRTGLRPALRVHDELVYVVPEREAEQLLAELQQVLRTPPRWWPELVVWSEGDCANSYGAAK